MKSVQIRRQKWYYVLFKLFAASLAVGVYFAAAYVSVSMMIERPAGEGVSEGSVFLMGMLGLPFAVIFAGIFIYNLLDIFTRYTADENGLSKKVLWRTRRTIPWDELAEVGISLQRNGSGFVRSLYFSKGHLTDAERASFSAFHTKCRAGYTFLIECGEVRDPGQWKDLCPLPVPPIKDHRSIQFNITTYRRFRQPDGTWGEITKDIIPEADRLALRRKWSP